VDGDQQDFLFFVEATTFDLGLQLFDYLLFVFGFAFLAGLQSVPVLEDLHEVLKTCQSDFGRLEYVDPDCAIDPDSTVMSTDVVADVVDTFGEIFAVLVKPCEDGVGETHYHLYAIGFAGKIFFEYFEQAYFVLAVAVLEEGEEAQCEQGQQFYFVAEVFQDYFVYFESRTVDACGEAGVEALCESFAEGDLLGQFGEVVVEEVFVEAVQPVAEIGPFSVAFEVAEQPVDVPLEGFCFMAGVPYYLVLLSFSIL
jgi:hypothetical protein